MDEVLKIIMEMAAKQSVNQSSKNNTSMNYDEVAVIKKNATQIAKFTKIQYDQFIAVGFTEEQAMELTVATLN